MKRINIFVDETQLYNLKKLPGTISEHIREALFDYIEKKQSASVSNSTIAYRIGGKGHGEQVCQAPLSNKSQFKE